MFRGCLVLSIILSSLFGLVSFSEAVDLSNATASYTQINASNPDLWAPSKTIDGAISGGFTSWGIDRPDDTTTSESIVWETQQNTGFAGGTTFTFNLHYKDGVPSPDHSLGRFRLSYTTDDRSHFADGGQIGGDVTANWVALNPTAYSSTGGETFTKLGDSSLLVSGGSNFYDTYTIQASTLATGITGFRLDALEFPTLPHNGPGRAGQNGNFGLSEFQVTTGAGYTPGGTVVVGSGGIGGVANWDGDKNHSWSERTNWLGNNVPPPNAVVRLQNGAKIPSVDYDLPNATYNTVIVDNNMEVGMYRPVTLSSVYETIGNDNHGTFKQYDGTNNVEVLRVGPKDTSHGAYILQGGNLNVGTLQIGPDNSPGKIFTRSYFPKDLFFQAGGTLTAGQIINNGQYHFDGGQIHGAVVNNGIFGVKGTPHFTGSFTNNGFLVSDPTQLYFQDLIIGEDGFIQAFVDDEYHIAGDFINNSHRFDEWDTATAKLLFGIGEHTFELPGEKRTDNGFDHNFVWDTLDLTEAEKLFLKDGNLDNFGGALYVLKLKGLKIDGDLIGNLDSNGFDVFYDPLFSENNYLQSGTFALAGGGFLKPFDSKTTAAVPEPSSLLLISMGMIGLARSRKKSTK